MKKLFLMAAFAAFAVAGNAQTASTTEAAPAPAKKACCASMSKTSCASMTKTECAKAMSEGKCAEGTAAACHGEKAAKTSMTSKVSKKAVATTNKP